MRIILKRLDEYKTDGLELTLENLINNISTVDFSVFDSSQKLYYQKVLTSNGFNSGNFIQPIISQLKYNLELHGDFLHSTQKDFPVGNNTFYYDGVFLKIQYENQSFVNKFLYGFNEMCFNNSEYKLNTFCYIQKDSNFSMINYLRSISYYEELQFNFKTFNSFKLTKNLNNGYWDLISKNTSEANKFLELIQDPFFKRIFDYSVFYFLNEIFNREVK